MSTHDVFVEAFYATALFKLERWLLRFLVARPSTDAEAHELARGERYSFAAWSVEARTPDQVLLRDFNGLLPGFHRLYSRLLLSASARRVKCYSNAAPRPP